MDEALAFVGRDRTLRPERRRARPQHLRQAARPRATTSPALVRARPAARSGRAALAGEEGDEVWALLLADGPHRRGGRAGGRAREEVSLLAKHTFAVAQAFHSYYQKPRYSVLHAETDDLRAFRDRSWSTRSCAQMQVLVDLLGIPIPDRM